MFSFEALVREFKEVFGNDTDGKLDFRDKLFPDFPFSPVSLEDELLVDVLNLPAGYEISLMETISIYRCTDGTYVIDDFTNETKPEQFEFRKASKAVDKFLFLRKKYCLGLDIGKVCEFSACEAQQVSEILDSLVLNDGVTVKTKLMAVDLDKVHCNHGKSALYKLRKLLNQR